MSFLIYDSVKFGTLAFPNFAANGAIGTAANTVDMASSFVITQTTASISLTIPSPTDAQAGDRLQVANATESTTSITVAGIVIPVGGLQEFMWTGTAWVTNISGIRNQGTSVSVATVGAGTLTVTHNLGLPSGKFSSVVFRAYNSAGSEIIFKRNKAGDTANALSLTIPVAITTNLPIVFDIAPLS